MNPGPIESLETRRLLSISGWPAAPFPADNLRATIFVNQYGHAALYHQSFGSRSYNGYNLYYDDPGGLSVDTASSAPVDEAFYNTAGKPSQVDIGGASNHIQAQVPPRKRRQYVAVRGNPGTTYDLLIDGPPAGYIEIIRISRVHNAGSAGSDISSAGDFDFYSFSIPRSGNWIVKVIPDPGRNSVTGGAVPLDATMKVYDSKGRPVGRSYTRTIDKGGPGIIESWMRIGATAGQKLYVRVDGAGGSLGGYGVSVALALGSDVSIKAVDPTAGLGAGTSQFRVTRTDISTAPLTLHYSISGTAWPGVDYQALSGSVTIPGNRLSANILVRSLSLAAHGKAVVLTLLPAEGFNLYPSRRAMVTIK